MDAAVVVEAVSSPERVEDARQESWFIRFLLAPPVWAISAGIIWISVFSAGVLMDSQPYREALGWTSTEAQHSPKFDQLVQQLVPAVKQADGDARMDVQNAWALLASVTAEERKAADAKDKRLAAIQANKPRAFMFGMVLFTPTNVAILALLAGFIGGCASKGNVSEREQLVNDIKSAASPSDRRLLMRRLSYLDENPVFSMTRSFVVYLVFISGLYVVSSDPFSPETQAQGFTQYIRLAGLVSLLGFIVGYDPTRFKSWLDMVPTPIHSPKTRGEDAGRDSDHVRIDVGQIRLDAEHSSAHRRQIPPADQPPQQG